MAAMKPRTGDGPLEATKEGRGIVMRVPLEGGGRLVVELTPRRSRRAGRRTQGRHKLAISTQTVVAAATVGRGALGRDGAVDIDCLLGDVRPGEFVDAPLPAGHTELAGFFRFGDK